MHRLFWPLYGLSLVQVVFEWLTLSEVVASHFGPTGLPDATMSRSGFCLFHLFIVTFLTAVFAATRAFVRSLPIDLINLPYKEYWLADERRDASLERLDATMRGFGASTLLLLVVVMFLTWQANHHGRPLDTAHFGIAMTGYLCLMAANLHRLFRAFPPPPHR